MATMPVILWDTCSYSSINVIPYSKQKRIVLQLSRPCSLLHSTCLPHLFLFFNHSFYTYANRYVGEYFNFLKTRITLPFRRLLSPLCVSPKSLRSRLSFTSFSQNRIAGGWVHFRDISKNYRPYNSFNFSFLLCYLPLSKSWYAFTY